MFSPLWKKVEVFLNNTKIYKCSICRAYFMIFKEAKRRTHLTFLHEHAFLEYQSSPQQQMTISYNLWNSSACCTDGEEHTPERAHNLHKVPSDSVLQVVAPGEILPHEKLRSYRGAHQNNRCLPSDHTSYLDNACR